VHRDRVAREGVDREHVELLRGLALQHEAGVAERRLDRRVAVGEVGEVAVRDPDHRRIDVVEAVHVVLRAPGGDRAGAEADHADLERLEPRVQRFDRAPDARGGRVVARRPPAQHRVGVLGAVHDRAVDQAAAAVVLAAALQDAQHAVEVARREDRAVVELPHVPHRAADGGHERGDRERAEHEVVAAHLPGEERRAQHQRGAELEVRGQQERREDADEDRAQRAAERDRQVEAGQVARRGLQEDELAVAEHAREEEPGAEHADLDRELVREVGVGLRPRHHAERRGDHRHDQVALVPAGAVEAQDERQEVERQRQDPQQRHGGDVLRDVVRDREQQDRAGGRERDPQRLPRERRRRLVGGVLPASGRLGRRSARRAQARDARRRGEHDERHVADRPAPGLRARGHPGLEQERIADEREHRGEVRQREEPVGATAGEMAREPGLHERARRREQEIRQPDRRDEHAEDQPQRVLVAGGLPVRGGHDRQQRDARDEQRDVQPEPVAGRRAADHPVRVRVPREQRGLEEDEAGRPYRRRSAEPRQDLLRHHRLHEEQQEGAREDRDGVERHDRGGGETAARTARGPAIVRDRAGASRPTVPERRAGRTESGAFARGAHAGSRATRRCAEIP